MFEHSDSQKLQLLDAAHLLLLFSFAGQFLRKHVGWKVEFLRHAEEEETVEKLGCVMCEVGKVLGRVSHAVCYSFPGWAGLVKN